MILAVPLSTAARQPVGLPADVRAACDSVHSLIIKTPGIKARRTSGTLADEMLRAPVAGCKIDIDGSMKALGKATAPTDGISQYLDAQQWTDVPEFSADGHDGTTFAYRKSGVACLVRGQWDGGSDDEPDAPAADPYQVLVLCGRSADFVRR